MKFMGESHTRMFYYAIYKFGNNFKEIANEFPGVTQEELEV